MKGFERFGFALAGVLLFRCSSGVGDKPCQPGCVDEKTRLECNGDGTPRSVPCEQPAEACAESVCRTGTCRVQPAVGASCGKDGTAKCNAAYVCLGPNLQLTAIRQHTCAVADDGKVWCWGTNKYGEHGDGTKEDRANPVPVRGLPGAAVMAAAGYGHTCALLESGEVYCWGSNRVGQTAPDSTDDPILEPTLVTSPVAFTKIFAGQGHTCGLTADATVYCWGSTEGGQCGVDPIEAIRVGPNQIPGLDHVKTVVTVKNHLCALRTEDPTMVCWGSNQYLEHGGYIVHKLGPGAATMNLSPTPVPVDLGKKVIAIGMAYESTFAVTEDGMMYGWGLNNFDGAIRLGSNRTELFLETPTAVLTAADTPLTNILDTTRSDGSDMCALVGDADGGSHYVCWGENDYGELGLGVPGYQIFPYADNTTILPASASNIVRGEDHGCATVTENDEADVWCWGRGKYVANGSLDADVAQADPAPVKWDPAAFEPFLEKP